MRPACALDDPTLFIEMMKTRLAIGLQEAGEAKLANTGHVMSALRNSAIVYAVGPKNPPTCSDLVQLPVCNRILIMILWPQQPTFAENAGASPLTTGINSSRHAKGDFSY
jgi:hypothetical protein